MASHVHLTAQHYHHLTQTVQIVGHPVSDTSTHLLKQLAVEAQIRTIHITSVIRSVEDQARTFYEKHVANKTPANYKNPAVSHIVAHARKLLKDGNSPDRVKAYLIDAVEHAPGGPRSVSPHIGVHIFSEVFDVGVKSMTHQQARAFLVACRKRMPSTITRLGHSKELGFELPQEFRDEGCFHFEVKQLLWDKLEQPTGTMIA